MGRTWDTMTRRQREHWRADFKRYYKKAHSKALEKEYDFIAQMVGEIANIHKISRTVAAAVDPTRNEGMQYMIIDDVLLRDHWQLDEWQSQGEEIIEVSNSTRLRLNLSSSSTLTLKKLVGLVKEMPLS
jgi:hypothetical protein